MSLNRHLRHLALTACVIVITLLVPVAASASTDLVLGISATRAVGTDRIAVWVCEVPSTSTHDNYASSSERVDIDPIAVAAWAQAEAAPHFHTVSGGRYRMIFEVGGRLTLAPSDGPHDCLEQARQRSSSPFTNVLATDTYINGGRHGFATPGRMYADPQHAPDLLSQAPADSGRGAYVSSQAVGGHRASEPHVEVLLHEMGHALGWPHSYTGHHDEYDNPLDVMSVVSRRHRAPLTTLAVNRLAAGWLDPHQVHVHRAGTSDVMLWPVLEDDTQLVLVPSVADARVMLTLEARTPTRDAARKRGSGVAVHVVDQTTQPCKLGKPRANCYGIFRRQGQAWGAAHSHDHVVRAGGQVTIDGLTISVSRAGRHAYSVRVEGEYQPTDPFLHTGPRRRAWVPDPALAHIAMAGGVVGFLLGRYFDWQRIRQRRLPCHRCFIVAFSPFSPHWPSRPLCSHRS